MTEPCRDRRDPIQELLDGELAGPARAELEAHLVDCAGCRAYQAGMAGLFGRLDEALRLPGPSPELDPAPPVVVPFRPRQPR
ncbi:MAG: hypothetical protein JWM80_3399, partial [Cyanobacteria bacterium RYN_339]|nr:hypothetical protein [Cyanobacteria bacterium RYN_339]